VAGAAAKTKAFSRLFWAANKTKVVRKAHGVMDDMGRMRKPGQGNMDLLKDYIKARRTVKKLLDDEVIKIADNGDAAFREWVEKDLRQIASSDTGRKVLGDIAGSGKQIIIEPLDSLKVPAAEQAMGPHALKMEPARAYNGKGTGTKLRLNPDYPFTRDMPSDRALVHELGHSRNNALGQNKGMQRPPPDFDQHRWGNLEEFDNIKNVDNAYANEWKLAEREGHRHIPGMPGGGYLPPPKPAPYAPPPGVPLAGPDGSIPAPPPPKGKGHTPVMMPAAPPAPAPSPPAGGGGPPASPPPPPKGKGHTPVMMPAVPPAPPPGGSL
jgi:hypothetical protein